MLTDKGIREALFKFNQRKLHQGEKFLLAKAIADELPLPPFMPDDEFRIFMLRHKQLVENVCYTLNEFSYLSPEDVEWIYDLVSSLLYWRFRVAYDPPYIYFRGEAETVIDDISCLPKYVNITAMCSVGDMVSNANYTYTLFRKMVINVKANCVEDAEDVGE